MRPNSWIFLWHPSEECENEKCLKCRNKISNANLISRVESHHQFTKSICWQYSLYFSEINRIDWNEKSSILASAPAFSHVSFLNVFTCTKLGRIQKASLKQVLGGRVLFVILALNCVFKMWWVWLECNASVGIGQVLR